ncbi:hypothetical protein BD408DRAFT_432789 [Parasitella parasitica]|nr:hypothetical protein BD408DRAFT_432789 [Parasitella parasitica]
MDWNLSKILYTFLKRNGNNSEEEATSVLSNSAAIDMTLSRITSLHHRLTLRWGDTNMENTDAPFKVDLRVISSINEEKYDVDFAEFAKNFSATKAQKDRVKLILESDIYDQTIHLVKALLKFKERCLQMNDIIKKELTIKNQERLSFETVLNKSAKKKYRSQPIPLKMISVPEYYTPLWLEEGYQDE